ncbi:MAG: hypothetical protein ABI921_12815 [Panacibacter sp.]
MKQENPTPPKKGILKPASLILNALLIAGIAYFFLTEKNQWNNDKPELVKQCDICTDSLNYPPFNYLQVHTLKDMANLYQGPLSTRRFVTQSNGNRVPDANSIWFSLDALKQFIWEIQKDTCGKSCDGQGLQLGVRIYYSRYPKIDSVDASGTKMYPDLQSVIPDYDNMHTAFMIPTYDSSGYQKDFDPRYFDLKNKCNPITINPDTWPAGNKILALVPNNYVAKNHGGLCPPLTNCKGSAF